MDEQTGYVYFRGGLSATERDAVLDALPNLTAVIHHSPTRIQFDAWRPAALAAHGRAFGPEWEVRWEGDGNGRYDVLVSGEQPNPHLTAPDWQLDAPFTVDKLQEIYLWGDYWRSRVGADDDADDRWVQPQIEAALSYPVAGDKDKPLVRVEARQYRQAGIIRLTRFSHLKAAEVNHG
ncbi:MAG: hypothetical protein IAE79_13770 [Anaerolinea sp.]|nr:hypothetical protein [Anaerolinea sp.]